ncbi:MAG: hypothetical protein KDD02_05245, partial [Phaeodactylibacter sp.]|nr:hypothetical protein [Phaeodactylibacter sp.]
FSNYFQASRADKTAACFGSELKPMACAIADYQAATRLIQPAAIESPPGDLNSYLWLFKRWPENKT